MYTRTYWQLRNTIASKQKMWEAPMVPLGQMSQVLSWEMDRSWETSQRRSLAPISSY